MSKLCPIPFCTPTVFMSVKGITWLWIRLGLYDDLEKILCTTNWYTKFFLVYWLITYIAIFSGGINRHENSIFLNICSRLGRHSFRSFIRWIRLLSGLSGYDLTHYHDQAVDKNNTEGHSPCANVNCINLCLLHYDCLDLDGKDQKTVSRLSRFIDLR